MKINIIYVHSSGSCSLPTDNDVVNYLNQNLLDIINFEKEELCIIKLKNKPNTDILEKIIKLPGYLDWDKFCLYYTNLIDKYYNIRGNILIFQNQYNVENQDVTQRIKEIKALLVTQKNNAQLDINISETYAKFMEIMLELNNTYSSFIEVVFTNMFIKNKIPIRYFLKDDYLTLPDTRLNYKQINKVVSKLLGLIYEPNSISIAHFGENDNSLQLESNTIFEKLWNGQI